MLAREVGHLLRRSGEALYMTVERRIIMHGLRRVPLRIDRHENEVELVGVWSELLNPRDRSANAVGQTSGQVV